MRTDCGPAGLPHRRVEAARGVEASRLYVRTWRKKKQIDNLRHRLEALDGRISKSVELSLQG